MAKFDLTVAGTAFSLIDDGRVSTSAGPFGTWNTDGKSTNQIIITPKAGGAAVNATVPWKFNDKNQLCLMQGDNVLFNFSQNTRPRLHLDGTNVLHVLPTTADFEFILVCSFDLDQDVDLAVTIGATTSKIIGTPDTNAAQFAYSFNDKAIAGPPYFLPFTGEWIKDKSNGEEDVRLVFQGTAAGKPFALKLPPGASLSGKNQLFVTGVKQGEAWGVEIEGTLTIQKDFTLVFSLERQSTAAGVKTTEITIRTIFDPQQQSRLGATLDLHILNTDDPHDRSHKLSVTGKGHFVLGKTGLDITFAYAKSSAAGQPAIVAVLVGASFSWSENALAVTFKKEGGVTTATLTSDFVLNDKLRAQVYLNITQGQNQQKGVYGALGLRF
jgi:hypothetical protein